MLFYCCVTADILTKLLQQCFLIFIVVPWLYLGNSQVSVYRTIGPTLVLIMPLTLKKLMGHIAFGACVRGWVGACVTLFVPTVTFKPLKLES